MNKKTGVGLPLFKSPPQVRYPFLQMLQYKAALEISNKSQGFFSDFFSFFIGKFFTIQRTPENINGLLRLLNAV